MKKLITFFTLLLGVTFAQAEPRDIGLYLKATTYPPTATLHAMCRDAFTETFTEVTSTGTPVGGVCGSWQLDRGQTMYCTMEARLGADVARSTELTSWTRPKDDHYRINAGGGAYTDTLGNVWSADSGYGSCGGIGGGAGAETAVVILGTDDQKLFQSERWNHRANISKPLTYRFPVNNGAYLVKLYFADRGANRLPGERVFDVNIEDQTVLKDFDITKEAGAGRTALVKTFQVDITDGYVDLSFVHGVAQNPQINAIEIVQTIRAVSGLTLEVY